MTAAIPLTGFVNAHSHAFQRALRGRAAGTDFWTWRDGMLEEADRATPESVEEHYADVYGEMLAAGYTAVGEFHYLGAAEASAAAGAAAAAGIAIVLLHVAYERGGLDRMRQPSVAAYLEEVESLRAAGIAVGVAPHSVRACSRTWLEEIAAYASREQLPLHIHADEQPREIQECVEEHGCRPIELLADVGCLSERTTIIHATHANDDELDLLAASGAGICACPTTESDLGDGFLRVTEVLDRAIPLCIGSDSNMRIDPFEELRELEGIARRQTGRRGILTTAQLLEIGSAAGARALHLEEWAAIEIDPGHRSLSGVAPEHVEAALIAGCTADVVLTRERDRVDVTEETFETDVIARSADRPVVVDFWAEWCGPCHALAPVLEAAVEARAGAVTLVKVDVDANQGLSQRFSVSGIPAVKAFRDGRVVAEFAGARSRAAVDTFLDELLAPPRADALIEELRAAGELPSVVAALDAGDTEAALQLIVGAVPAADPEERERLRDVAVALFERLDPDDPLVGTYRRRLASALF